MTKETKPDAWMPLYIGDYKKDTGRLTTELHGAYLLLIMEYWNTGPLIDDDDELAAITVTSAREWKRMRPKVARFFAITDGFWRHKRIDDELAKWSERKARAVERARKGGEATASSRKKGASSSASSTQQAVLKGRSSSSSIVEGANYVAPSHNERDAPDERADGSSPRPAWDGPADFREAVCARHGPDFARTWLDQTSWQDVPERAIICRLKFTADRLRHDLKRLLTEHGIAVRTEAERAA